MTIFARKILGLCFIALSLRTFGMETMLNESQTMNKKLHTMAIAFKKKLFDANECEKIESDAIKRSERELSFLKKKVQRLKRITKYMGIDERDPALDAFVSDLWKQGVIDTKTYERGSKQKSAELAKTCKETLAKKIGVLQKGSSKLVHYVVQTLLQLNVKNSQENVEACCDTDEESHMFGLVAACCFNQWSNLSPEEVLFDTYATTGPGMNLLANRILNEKLDIN
ncbi:MAG: hypothetical protein M1549_01800 [Candidatus Dependentiae bacterium]|nr:hypothetical protein [Candidatus Dependentiae bacterium]